MAKVLFRRGKKEFVKDINKEITIAKQRFHYVLDESKDFITEDGKVDKKDLKKKDGSVIKTNTNKEFIIFSAGFIDNYRFRNFVCTCRDKNCSTLFRKCINCLLYIRIIACI